MTRPLRLVSSVLLVVGALLLADALTTLVWQEPASALYSHLQQDRLEGELAALDAQPLLARQARLLDRLRAEERLPVLARALARRLDEGDPIGRLEIPRLDEEAVMVEGTNGDDLREGPGHYADTALPGQGRAVAVAGHRTTYSAPFRHLDELRSGDRVRLEMPYGTFVYAVRDTRIVKPDALWVTRRAGRDRLVLTACHPLYSARQRIVVFARLLRAVPRSFA